MKLVAPTKGENGYKENLYKTNNLYFRVVRTVAGEWYHLYVNDSQYGEPKYDFAMCLDGRAVRNCTISECIADIKRFVKGGD